MNETNAKNDMLDEKGKQNFFQNIDQLWIRPELEKRFGTTSPENFRIWEALIKLPVGETPIVEFNDEINWEFKFKASDDVSIEKDQIVYLNEIEEIQQALPPSFNGDRVSFVYLFWSGYSYRVIFDFSPNNPDFDQQNDEFALGYAIANHFLNKLTETTVKISRSLEQNLRKIGLWIIPTLLPFTISKIAEKATAGQLDDARSILVKRCNPDFIEGLVETWKPIKVFDVRRELFKEAVFTHRNGKFRSSIYTLVPQIEGTITDWLYSITKTVEHKLEDRIPQFRGFILNIPEFEYAYREALNSCVEFMLDGPPLQKFGRWLNVIDSSFAGRHPITHGKYQDDIFTEENSIKLFLLLDTICQFMMFYEVRVLSRDLGQNSQIDEPS